MFNCDAITKQWTIKSKQTSFVMEIYVLRSWLTFDCCCFVIVFDNRNSDTISNITGIRDHVVISNHSNTIRIELLTQIDTARSKRVWIDATQKIEMLV